MLNLPFKGLAVALLAGAALSLSIPASAADRDHHRARAGHGHGHRVVVGHGPRRHVVRFKRFGHGPVLKLSVGERARWRVGRWWHGRRHGRVGWWWLTGGIWYWYPERVGVYPSEISTTAVYDYAPEGRSDDSWYYCNDPQGYYPYVQSCNSDWKPVPIQPQANADDGAYGEPPYAGDDENSGDDEGSYNDDESGDDEGDDDEAQ
jgi:hypothetical protein